MIEIGDFEVARPESLGGSKALTATLCSCCHYACLFPDKNPSKIVKLSP